MIRISDSDFQKLIVVLKKESAGGPLIIKEDGANLRIITMDRNGKELMIEISDISYPMMPRLTRTETF